MSNLTVNREIPKFQDKYGTDWGPYNSITEDFDDYLIERIWALYRLKNLNTIPERALEVSLRAMQIQFDASDTFLTKKLKRRKYVSQYQKKSLAETYLDTQEAIVGTRGVIYSGFDVGVWRWDYSVWPNPAGGTQPEYMRWSANGAQFEIYIDVKTTDDDLLDQIVLLWNKPSTRPAFYRIYLVDSDFTVLRTIN